MKPRIAQDFWVTTIRILPRYVVLALFSLIILIPLAWILVGSVKPPAEIFGSPVKWIPSQWMWNNYWDAWNAYNFAKFTLNSIIMTGSVLVGYLSLATMAGYGFAKFSFPGQKLLFIFVLSTMMLPVEVTMIPLFLVVKSFGWIDTYQGLIVPLLVNAFGVFFMRQYILSIPDELIDAARIDGASELRIFFSVIVPLSRPALAGLGLLVGIGIWGEFLWPIIVSQTNNMVTLPLALAYFKSTYANTPYNWILAMSVVMAIPPVVLFMIFQRQLIESGVLTGMK